MRGAAQQVTVRYAVGTGREKLALQHRTRGFAIVANQMTQLLFIALIIGVFYFLVIRPQQKRAKEQRDMVSALQPGDEVVTIGGIFGTVVDVGERITIRTSGGAELEVAKQALSQLVPTKADADSE